MSTAADATADGAAFPESDEGTGEARILAHSYDGIREYDNPLPGWWSTFFILSIVFAAAYGAYYHLAGWGQTPAERYQAGLAAYDAKREQREAAEAAATNEDSLQRAAADPVVVARGATIFAAKCASCHEKQGQGLIGPNLTDDFQLRGATRMDVFTTVRGGVPGTAMLAWGELLSGPDIADATAFVISLRNTHVAGKEPQGAPVEPFARAGR